MAQVDVSHPPSGGFQNGGWYWDPKVNAARQYWNGNFGGPGIINNPGQQGYGQSAAGGSVSPSTPSSSSPLEDVNKALEDSYQKLQDEVTQKFGDYQAGNPFKVDQVLANKTTEAKEQIDPYYDQLLGDYLSGVTRKINRGNDDTRDLLSELDASTSSYVQDATNNENNSLNTADKGYAENGLIGSGDQLNTEGQIKQGTGANIADYTRKAGEQATQLKTANQRNIEDTNADATTYQTNLEQNRSTDVNTRAADLTKEAGQQYVQGFQQTLPTQLQSASGFDMLKSLGIYS